MQKDGFLTADKANETVNNLRRNGLNLDGANAYKSDICDAIVGALAFGKQGRNPPPDGHWLQHFWDIGRAEGELQEELVTDLRDAAATFRRYEELHRAKGASESDAKAEVNASLAARFEATIAKATA